MSAFSGYRGFRFVRSRGEITLPIALRRRLRLMEPGSQVEVVERRDGVIELRPAQPASTRAQVIEPPPPEPGSWESLSDAELAIITGYDVPTVWLPPDEGEDRMAYMLRLHRAVRRDSWDEENHPEGQVRARKDRLTLIAKYREHGFLKPTGR